MRPRRIYLPLAHERLRALAADRVLAAPVRGFAPGAADARLATTSAAAGEEAEYLAFTAAAEAAAAAGADGEAASGGASRRVVAAADAPAEAVREVEAPGQAEGPVAVETTEDLPLRLVVSLHIDEEPADGDQDERELLWYDITELDVVLEELGLSP